MTRPLVGGPDLASLAQHGMWVTERSGAAGPTPRTTPLPGHPAVYRMPLAVWFDGPMEVGRMLAACGEVVRRHPVLTSTLAERDGVLRLLTGTAEVPVTLAEAPADPLDLAGEGHLDLATGPLARFTLARTGPDRYLLVFAAHHIVFDGMSKDILVRDLAAAYAGEPLPPLPVPYGEAVEDENARVRDRLPGAAEFWRARWHDSRELVLPGLGTPTLHAAPGDAVDFVLGDEVGRTAAPLGLTRFEVVLSALRLLLHAYGNARAAVAVDLSTRTEATREHIGLFVNELPLDVVPSGTFAEFAADVRAELRRMYAYRHVPLARALGGVSPRAALTPVSLSYRARSEAEPVFPGLAASVEWMMFNGAVRNTLHLQVVDGPRGTAARLQYNPRHLGRAGCESVAADLTALLRGVAERPHAPIDDLPLPSRVAGAAGGTGLQRPRAGGTDSGLVVAVGEIWRQVLDLDHVDPGDDLFDLGGHSLSITQIIAKVRDTMAVDLPFEVFIDDPTVEGVAAEVARQRSLA
ncbi:condensation domain-containing protein [Nonomuraea roseola]|uniref:Condensation domain-containing protein n=1 Tax=Nonomuraea roseola TaxID=46179 RepID=A0ABV5QBK5_9ACTN